MRISRDLRIRNPQFAISNPSLSQTLRGCARASHQDRVSRTHPVPAHPRDLTAGRRTDKLGFTWAVYSDFSGHQQGRPGRDVRGIAAGYPGHEGEGF